MKHECGFCGKIWDCGFAIEDCRWGVVRHFCARCEAGELSPRGKRKEKEILSRLLVNKEKSEHD